MKLLRRLALVGVLLALVSLLAASRTMAAGDYGRIEKNPYGTTASGVAIDEYTLTNVKGL
jgi:hypothetical protein